ncbi:MAG: 4-hydroxythreonine-4-phosphate dehydrogenase PdxA [Candidatus Omnitrophica bacterium]|nr:4-hydroxythreonine-4-phosphate dehydrogenase PdxA [Candidatus Omnitrophota bacterium]
MNSKSKATLKSSTIRVGLTIGDPAGIGPAIALKALEALKGQVNFRVIGDSFVLNRAARALRIKSLPAELIDLNNVQRRSFSFGRINALNGKASLGYLDAAAELLRKKEIDCLVTCPVSKEAVTLAGSKFTGHTEYLAKEFNCKDLVMMLVNDKLRFSLLTRHIPLKDVCGQITRSGLENNILNTIKGLKRLFSIRKPRIVICGVNPHASDNGIIGTEELRIIKPAILNLRNKHEDAAIIGPLPADVAIYQAAKGNFDCVIALYHDQALIPLKLTDFNTGINLTLGLPFVRTSPLHGTAFDLAVNPVLANPGSLISAVKLAIQCTLNQKKA